MQLGFVVGPVIQENGMLHFMYDFQGLKACHVLQ